MTQNNKHRDKNRGGGVCHLTPPIQKHRDKEGGWSEEAAKSRAKHERGTPSRIRGAVHAQQKSKVLPSDADALYEEVSVRLYLQIFALTLLLHSCHGGLSNRGPGGFNIDQTGQTDLCAGQTSPSPQCPDETLEPDETPEPAKTLEPDGDQGPPELTEYKDGMWGSIAVRPLAIKKDEEAQLQMTFTAAKAIAQENTPIDLIVDFPHPNTGFKLNKVEVSPAAAKDFFERTPSVFTSSTTNKATAPMMKMDEGAQFTLTFTITPQQNFEFKARTTNIRFFKNSRGEMPKITVYTGTAPVTTHDLSPIYTNGKLEMRLKPWPHKIKKSMDSDLTLTFTAVANLDRKSTGRNGQLTHDVPVGISPYNAVSTYKVTAVSTREYFKDNKQPHCSIKSNCSLNIVEMKKGESFELKLTINASEDFSIGYSNKTGTPLKKKHDEINSELDGKRPQIEVE